MEQYIAHSKEEVAKRVGKVIKTFCDKEGISRRAFCKRYGFNNQTVQHYVKDRVDSKFVAKLVEITGASIDYILIGVGEMFSERKYLTEGTGFDTKDAILIPFGWEVSTFHPDKLRSPAFYFTFPAMFPLTEYTKERKMVALIVDRHADIKGSDLVKGDIVFVDLNERDPKPGKVYLFSCSQGTCIRKLNGSKPDDDMTILGRIFLQAKVL